MRCGACCSNASTVAGFATSTTWTSHPGVALLRPEHHWPSSSTVACSTTRVCSCKRQPLWAQTVTDVFLYELLMRLFHIGNFCFWVPFFKQLLLRNCAVDFVEICNVYVGRMKPLREYLILMRYAAVIVIWIWASLFGTQCILKCTSKCQNLQTKNWKNFLCRWLNLGEGHFARLMWHI